VCGVDWTDPVVRKPNNYAELIYREVQPYDFRRVYELDPSIDTTKVGAKIDDGILTVTLPKAESVKPRKISVQ
jgi:HSP20 family protein